MRSRRIHPKELAIQRVGKPRQWMPVRGIISSERPGDSVPAQTRFNVCVLSYVMVVVEIDKRVVANRQVGEHSQQHHGEREDETPLTRRRKQFPRFQRRFRSCELSCDRGHWFSGPILSRKKGG